jgi:hypothetical protein
MVPAWANYYGLTSTDAYHNSDNYPYCFIGFEGMSPSIRYDSFRYYSCVAYLFVEKAYSYLAIGYTVHDALDYASRYSGTFNLPYDQSPLFTGFESWWSGNYGGQTAGWYSGSMKVYGHSGIQLVW